MNNCVIMETVSMKSPLLWAAASVITSLWSRVFDAVSDRFSSADGQPSPCNLNQQAVQVTTTQPIILTPTSLDETRSCMELIGRRGNERLRVIAALGVRINRHGIKTRKAERNVYDKYILSLVLISSKLRYNTSLLVQFSLIYWHRIGIYTKNARVVSFQVHLCCA